MHRYLAVAVLLLSLAPSLACLGPRLARCPAQGGRPWVELDSGHFNLQTDLPLEQAQEAMIHLERTRAALLAAAWPSASTRAMAKVQVYVLGSTEDFENLFPRRIAGLFLRPDNSPMIILHGPPNSWERRFTGRSQASSSTLKHELTHYLSSYFLLRQPRWLAEGLAEFLETMHLSEDGRTAVLGVPHLRAVSDMKTVLDAVRRGLVEDWSIRQVFSWDGPNDTYKDWEIASMYSGSWLLVHWLYNTRPEQFVRFQALLATGMEPEKALSQEFPDLLSSNLDDELLEYLKHGTYHETTVRVPAIPLALSERALEDAEVHALRARLAAVAMFLSEEGQVERLNLMLGELEEALRLEPASLLALQLKIFEAPDAERLTLARTAVEAHPLEAQAWLLLAVALKRNKGSLQEMEEAYKKALEIAADEVRANNGLAWLYVTQRRYAEALPLAQRALELAPWSPYVLDTYAMAAAGLGRCSEAILAEQRAIDLLQEHQEEKLQALFRGRLAGFSPNSCPPPPLEP